MLYLIETLLITFANMADPDQAALIRAAWLGSIRARKLYTSARIYEWKFGKGEWKLPFASPTGLVDFFGFVIIFEEKKRTN